MSEEKKKDDNDAIFGLVAVMAVVAVVITIALFVLERLPVIGLGLFVGTLANAALFRYERGIDRLRGFAFTFGFFGLLFYVLLGSPVWLGEQGFVGALFRLDAWHELVFWCVNTWNANLPKFMNLSKNFHVNPRNVSMVAVSFYFWCSFGIAAFWTVWKAGWRAFRPGRGNDPWDLSFVLSQWPESAFSKVIGSITTIWIRMGLGARLNGLGHLAIAARLLPLAIGGGVLYWFGRGVQTLELQYVLPVIAFVPASSFVLGYLLGLTDGGLVTFDYVFGDGGLAPRKIESGFMIGRDVDGDGFWLTENNLGYHVEIIAPTGTGKTTLLQNLILNRIERGYGVILLDFKAEFGGVSWLCRAAKAAGREGDVRLLSLAHTDLSIPYNPIKTGDRGDIHSALMNAMPWSESYYRSIASVALMTLVSGLCEYRDRSGKLFHLGHVYELLDEPAKLRGLAAELTEQGGTAAPKLMELAARLDRPTDRKELMGLISNLNQLVHSAAGDLLSRDVIRGSFDFREAIEDRRIVCMLMNSLKLKESASVFGKLILQDLMRFVGDKYSQVERGEASRTALIIDEFASFAMPEFIEFMDRARGAGIGIVIAHQARADLGAISPEFQERVEANANTTIVSGIKSSKDAEHYAGMLGTRTTTKETRQVERGILWDHDTGMKSLRDVEEYVLHPNRLKQLNQGEAFVISRIKDPRWGLVRIARAPEFEEPANGNSEVMAHLKAIRQQYMQHDDRYLELSAIVAPGPSSPTGGTRPSESENWN